MDTAPPKNSQVNERGRQWRVGTGGGGEWGGQNWRRILDEVQ